MPEIRRVLLPWPPSVNNLFAHRVLKSKFGRGSYTKRFVSKQYRLWRKEAEIILRSQRWAQTEGQVSILICLTPPDVRKRDADNHTKAVIDSLVSCCVIPADDYTVVDRVQVKWDHTSPNVGALVSILSEGSQEQVLDLGPLTAAERRMLNRFRENGPTIPQDQKINKDFRALLAKGYIQEIPGLIEEAGPIGYQLHEDVILNEG